MSSLFKPSSSSRSLKKGNYGPFDFLASQDLFNKFFGKHPKLYSPVKKDGHWTQKEDLHAFMESCRFDVFMKSCQINYVESSNVSTESYVWEVCNNSSGLLQNWTNDLGQAVMDTPKIFSKNLLNLL